MGHLTFLNTIEFLYLPLLTQEAAVMLSAFAYGLRAGANPWLLVMVNMAAIVTDVTVFFVPAYVLAGRGHDQVGPRLRQVHDRAGAIVRRFGAFRAAAVASFILPSVSAMIVLGVLRLSFRRTLAGLLVGSTAYTLVPLLVAAPVASRVPRELIPILPWIAPGLAAVVILVWLVRSLLQR